MIKRRWYEPSASNLLEDVSSEQSHVVVLSVELLARGRRAYGTIFNCAGKSRTPRGLQNGCSCVRQDAPDLARRPVQLRYMLQHVIGDDDVEAFGLEW